MSLVIEGRPQWTVGTGKKLSTITERRVENKENERVSLQSTLVKRLLGGSIHTNNFLISHNH